MRQPFPLKQQQEPERQEGRSTASFTGQSIDEWLAAAVAEQATRAAARQSTIYGDALPGMAEAAAETARSEPTESAPARSPFVFPDAERNPAAPVHDRIAVETVAKTAEALGSVTNWIERAQEQLTAATRASSEAQKRTEAVVSQAIGDLGKRLEEIERKVDSDEFYEGETPLELSHPQDDEDAAKSDGPFKGLESRIRNIAGRVGPAGALGRRGVAAKEEVEAAVSEIRSHQARLERDASPDRDPDAPDPRRRHPGPMASLRADVDRLAQRIEGSGVIDSAGLEQLRRDLDALRGSVGALATRDQVGEIERTIQTLSIDVADVRHRGGDVSGLSREIEGLQSEIQRLADVRTPAEQFGKLSRDIDVLSHKLDIVAASGIDPALVEDLRAEVVEIRGMLAGNVVPPDMSGLGEQLSEIRRDIAKISARQLDPRDLTSLRIAFEEVRQALARPGATAAIAANFDDPQSALQQAAQDELRPVVAMMAELGRRFDRLEDGGLLEQLERQVAALTNAVDQHPGMDPTFAALQQGLADLMNEVANWRESTAALVEQAARRAAQEALGQLRGASLPLEHEVPVDSRRGSAIDDRANESLVTVHTRLEDVVKRIGRLESSPTPSENERDEPVHAPAPPESFDPPAPEPIRFEPVAHRPAPTHDPVLDEADRPLPPGVAARDEILLEPGAERPRPSIFTAPGSETAADIKADFIAAARRAAQAANADNGRGRGTRFSEAVESAEEREAGEPLRARIGATMERLRRPLLIGAGVVAVGLGGLRLVNEWTSGGSQSPARVNTAADVPVIAAPPANRPSTASRAESPEPQTTQGLSSGQRIAPTASIAPDRREPQQATETVTASVPTVPAEAPRTEEARNDAPAAPKPKVEASLSSPTQPLQPPATAPDANSPSSLNALKQAANTGDPVAMYELAARTADGRGVGKDLKGAASLFERAAEKGLAPAQYRTGNLYEKGIGVTRDLEAAKKWYQRAAENGNTRAMHNLAVLIAEGGGGRPDYATALTWFQRAADYGVRDSQFNLAVLSARGLGGNQDLVKSYTWFAVAAAQGDDEAGRKRDEVGGRLSPTDLAKAKATAERWRAVPANPAANEVQLPANGWTSLDANKRAGR